jgi:glycosyltransferase involved in cell wall biosynthesis
MKVRSASILIATYNRARLLEETLAAVQALAHPPACDVETIVVDNNSTDDTAAVVARAARGPLAIHYLREPRQGKSFALNRALSHASGDILVLTDDDVLPDGDWLARIVQDFREHEVTFVFGKVLPRWDAAPPADLLTREAQDIWGPLALLDYGNDAASYRPEDTGQRLPIGANLAFRRSAVVAVGGWRTDLGKVNNTLTSGEDHEIFARLRRLGLYSGYYDPDVAVQHHVPPARLRRSYFRRWFFWHGKTKALMLDDLYFDLDLSRAPHLAGVPRFLYRQAAEQACRWMRALAGSSRLEALIEELRMLEYVGLCVQCWRRRVACRGRAGETSGTHGPRGIA